MSPFYHKLFTELASFKEKGFTEEQFNARRDNHELLLQKSRNEAPFRFVLADMPTLMTKNKFTQDQLITAVKTISFKDLVSFADHLFDRVRFEWLVEGNLIQHDVIQMVEKSEEAFISIYNSKILERSAINANRVIKLNPNHTHLVELHSLVAAEKNNSFVRLYQISNGDTHSAEINFISNWMKTPYFEDLRTQQQLGYAVFSLPRVYNGVRLFGFCIQSDVKSNHYCIERTNIFLD